MPGLFDRIGDLVRSEWGARRRGQTPSPEPSAEPSARPPPSRAQRAQPRPPDINSAWRMLELEEGASLAEVRASYRRLAMRYQPRAAHGPHQEAASTVVETLTEAYEVLELHLREQGPA